MQTRYPQQRVAYSFGSDLFVRATWRSRMSAAIQAAVTSLTATR